MFNSSNRQSWSYKVSALKNFIQTLSPKLDITNRKSIQTTLKDEYIKYWKNKVITEKKMRTYIIYKNNFVYEHYLDILHVDLRKKFTRLRISAHNLPIERGRYTRPPIPSCERFCAFCSNEIGTELHFLINCKNYKSQRTELFKLITDECPLFTGMSDMDKFYFIMNSEGNILKGIAKFIKNHLP